MQPFTPPQTAKSWPETVQFFETLVGRWPHYEPLLQLVQQLAGSRYAASLFPATAMARLILAQAPDLTAATDRVFVDYYPNEDGFTIEAPEPAPFTTKLATSEAIAGLIEVLAGRR